MYRPPSSDVKYMQESREASCISIMEEKVPSKIASSRFDQPWINRKVKRFSRTNNKAYRKVKRTARLRAKQHISSSKKTHNKNVKRPTQTMGETSSQVPKIRRSSFLSSRANDARVPGSKS
ncbi:hypothetical protein DPMN_023824 [Dreissena polymorpha]|uniref:Uncharacterized protein n=1 Tax=Dreissena polymorpha TaxID=45954 RepID=A0A9D4LMZ0_DREPO|nr:hypothetical protein DPMN_023824 [Dreissena polymorpha]